ncbi:hypothetical protein L1049_026764 [Liquidambar formosana]|uniref:Uncharacterized protein n=1 Tax=Liquidambar formosana TaxID=63359 RepID=A0AAP0NG51_LIQFO
MTALFSAAYLPDFGPVPIIRAISLFFFRSMWAVRLVSILAVLAHIGEAIYAWHLAIRVDPANSKGWFWQTFALGFFSLRFLLKRARKLGFVLHRGLNNCSMQYAVCYSRIPTFQHSLLSGSATI